MRVDIEYIKHIQKERARINKVELEDIEFFEGGEKVDISQKIIDDFKFCGLNNTDFILTDYYKGDYYRGAKK